MFTVRRRAKRDLKKARELQMLKNQTCKPASDSDDVDSYYIKTVVQLTVVQLTVQFKEDNKLQWSLVKQI